MHLRVHMAAPAFVIGLAHLLDGVVILVCCPTVAICNGCSSSRKQQDGIRSSATDLFGVSPARTSFACTCLAHSSAQLVVLDVLQARTTTQCRWLRGCEVCPPGTYNSLDGTANNLTACCRAHSACSARWELCSRWSTANTDTASGTLWSDLCNTRISGQAVPSVCKYRMS